MKPAIQIRGFVNVLSPIVHNEILPQSKGSNPTPDSGAAKPQRTLRFILGKANGEPGWITPKLAVVAGNAVRGQGRRLLYQYTEDTLEYILGEMMDAKDARNLLYSLKCGGQTAKGTSPVKATAESYYEMQAKNPILDLLGCVFNGHHFEGSARVGFLVPYLQETHNLFRTLLPEKLLAKYPPEALMTVNEFLVASVGEIRYTRRSETGGAIGEGDKLESTEKEAMIYGTEYIPAGTIMVTHDTCLAESEGGRLAFKAMFALLAKNGIVGGMTGRGHGKVEFELFVQDGDSDELLDIEKSLTEYRQYLCDHKEEVVAAIQEFPNVFKATVKEAAKEAKQKE